MERTDKKSAFQVPGAPQVATSAQLGVSYAAESAPTPQAGGMGVSATFARAQALHEQEALATTFDYGQIDPQLRSTNTGTNAVNQQLLNTNLGGYMTGSQSTHANIGHPLIDAQEQRTNFPGGFNNQENIIENAGGDITVDFPLFNNHGPYTLGGASLHHVCMEYRNTGTLCYNVATYPCEEDHSYLTFNPHPVCHDCRLKPDLYDVAAEDEMIAKHRIYMCAQCTETRSNGPAQQLWEHPRRFPETKVRRVKICSCHDQLQRNWICEQHRILKAREIQIWGPEHVKSFRGFFGGDFCASCRVATPQTEGPKLMWQCAHCKDIVLLEQEIAW